MELLQKGIRASFALGFSFDGQIYTEPIGCLSRISKPVSKILPRAHLNYGQAPTLRGLQLL